MLIRIAQETDLPEIIAIYNQAVVQGGCTADLTELKIEEKINWFKSHSPDKYPLTVLIVKNRMVGWCSISPYRPGRMALQYTAEISYYIDKDFQRQGLASALVNHAKNLCPSLKIKSLIALLLEINTPSIKFLRKHGFKRWGYLPRVVDINGEESGHLIYGCRVY